MKGINLSSMMYDSPEIVVCELEVDYSILLEESGGGAGGDTGGEEPFD